MCRNVQITLDTSKGSYRSKKKIVRVWMMMNRKEELLPVPAAPLTHPPCPARSPTGPPAQSPTRLLARPPARSPACPPARPPACPPARLPARPPAREAPSGRIPTGGCQRDARPSPAARQLAHPTARWLAGELARRSGRRNTTKTFTNMGHLDYLTD